MALLEKNMRAWVRMYVRTAQKCSIKTRKANKKEWEMSVIAQQLNTIDTNCNNNNRISPEKKNRTK